MPQRFSIDNVRAIGLENFNAAIGQVSASWERFFNWHTGKTAIKRLNAIHGLGLVPEATQQGLTPFTLDDASTADIGRKQFGMQVRMSQVEMEETPELAAMVPEMMGRAVGGTYQNIGYNTLNSSFSAQVPLGPRDLIADNHPTETGTRSNKVASAFDRAALMAALVLATKWRDYRGARANFSSTGFNLAVSPEARSAAHEVIGSDVSSSENQSNPARGMADWSVEDVFDDPNDFLLVSKVRSPYHIYERLGPRYRADVDAHNPDVIVHTVYFFIGAALGPTPDGVIGGKA